LHEVRFFYIIGNFGEISYYVKSSPRDAQLAAEKFALRHRSRAKCVEAHTFLKIYLICSKRIKKAVLRLFYINIKYNLLLQLIIYI